MKRTLIAGETMPKGTPVYIANRFSNERTARRYTGTDVLEGWTLDNVKEGDEVTFTTDPYEFDLSWQLAQSTNEANRIIAYRELMQVFVFWHDNSMNRTNTQAIDWWQFCEVLERLIDARVEEKLKALRGDE